MTNLLLVSGFALLGVAAVGALVWFRRTGPKPAAPREQDEMPLLLEAAETKLRSAKLAGGLGEAPVVIVMGLPGSAKTSVVANAGIEAELLAGKAQQDGAIAPTPCLNVWWAGGTALVEAAGGILTDPASWTAFVNRIAPARLRAAFGGGTQAARSALVCFDLEMLFRAGASPATQARLLRARLGDLAENLGATLPVYALFTRADRVPFFTEFVRSLNKEEAASVLGATLPLDSPNPGLYADEQSARLGQSLDELFRSLAGTRVELLARETEEGPAGCAYEFPREFRKLRTAVCDFLVDLCRPSQFAAGPVLRGYYFSGVRPVIQEVAAPTRTPTPVLARAGATVMFRGIGPAEAEGPAQAPVHGTKKVPQWVFLTRLFRNVILADRAAMGASSASTRTTNARRWALGAAVSAGVLLTLGFTASWARNRSLEADALTAARGPVDSLERLDGLRRSLETLAGHHINGAPLLNRWGLYPGEALYPELRRLYFARFRTLLFAETQTKLVDALRALPAKPGPAYGIVYDDLKAYLITTSDHERSTRAYLAPVLLDRWAAGRASDPERTALAGRQFAYYADELKSENPYTAANDGYAVAKAREYLTQFSGVERVYRAMLADAAKAGPPIEFNRRFPGSAAAVIDSYEVSGAFTKPGWAFMQQAIRHPDRYFSGEQWVLGDGQGARFEPSKIEEQLRGLYEADFVNQWRAYLKAAAVVRYANLPDAARKLNLLAGNESPLLAAVSLASQNTAVESPAIAAVFQPAQAVSPAGAERLIGGPNQGYMSALLALQSAVEQAGGPAEAAAAPVLAAASNAKMAARQLAQGFKPDTAGHVDATVAKLLEDPITQVEGLLRALGPEELNAKGAALCGQMRPLLAKYPFDPNAATEASVAEVNAIFRKPDGALWTLYNGQLEKLLVRQGKGFAANPSATAVVTPAFLAFWNEATAVSDALANLSFTLRPEASEGIQNLAVTLDGQTLQYGGGSAAPKTFTWQAAGAHEAKASVRFGNGPDLVWSNSQGSWAMFHFFYKAERWQASGSDYRLEWTIRIGKDAVTLPNGDALTVRLDLNAGGLPLILQRGYLGRLGCVARVVR